MVLLSVGGCALICLPSICLSDYLTYLLLSFCRDLKVNKVWPALLVLMAPL